MQLIITGSNDNLNDFMSSNEQNVYGLILNREEDGSIKIDYNSKDEYEIALYICSCFLGFKSFVDEIKRYIEVSDIEEDGFVLMVNEMRKPAFVSYLALNTFKALRDFQEGSNSLNFDAFLKFGFKHMNKEVEMMANIVDAHLSYLRTQDIVENSSADEIKEILLNQLEDGADLEEVLPILRKLTQLDESIQRKDIYLKKEGNNYQILDDEGTELSVGLILSLICENLEFIISETDPLDLFLKDILFIQRAMWVERIVYYEDTFSEKERIVMQKFFKYVHNNCNDTVIEIKKGLS